VSYQEHDKCRGCGANVWGIDPAGRDLTWKAMHNEANCLAGKLDSSEKIVEAYGHAMIALREAIGIDAYAEHEDTIETIRRIRGRENTLDVRVQELESRLGEATKRIEELDDAQVAGGDAFNELLRYCELADAAIYNLVRWDAATREQAIGFHPIIRSAIESHERRIEAEELPEPERCLSPTKSYTTRPCMLLAGHDGECSIVGPPATNLSEKSKSSSGD
jgi:hypothetical protein